MNVVLSRRTEYDNNLFPEFFADIRDGGKWTPVVKLDYPDSVTPALWVVSDPDSQFFIGTDADIEEPSKFCGQEAIFDFTGERVTADEAFNLTL